MELAPKIRRVFDGLPELLCVAVAPSAFRSGPAFMLVMGAGATVEHYEAAMGRLRSFARLFGVPTIGMAGGPTLWMHVIYGRECEEWTRIKRRMNAKARSVDTNDVEEF